VPRQSGCCENLEETSTEMTLSVLAYILCGIHLQEALA
jgi:hypothetical protein